MKEKGIEWDRLMFWYMNMNQKDQVELITYKIKTTSKRNPKHMSSNQSNKVDISVFKLRDPYVGDSEWMLKKRKNTLVTGSVVAISNSNQCKQLYASV